MAMRYMASTPLKKLMALILAGICVFSVTSVFAGTGTKAKDVETNTSAFTNIGSNATTVQKALDRVDVLLGSGGGGGISEAPVDGQQYARQNAAWSVVVGGGSSTWGNITGNVGLQTDIYGRTASDARFEPIGLANSTMSSHTSAFNHSLIATALQPSALNDYYNKTQSDGRYLQNYTETDPIFNVSAAKEITAGNITDWNSKLSDAPSDGTQYARKDGNWSAVSVVTVETDPIFSNSTAKNITSSNVTNWNTAYSLASTALQNETDTLQTVTARGNTTSTRVVLNGGLSSTNAALSGTLGVTGTTSLGTTNIAGTTTLSKTLNTVDINAWGNRNTTETYGFGNYMSSLRSNTTNDPDKVDYVDLNGKALVNGLGAISGVGDYFYLVDKKPEYTVTTSGPTVSNIAKVFDNNIASNIYVPVANLSTTPFVLAIEKTDGSSISSTDVAQLVIIPHRLYARTLYACFTDWKIETMIGATHATAVWTEALNRTGVTDYGLQAIPVYVAASGYTNVYGVRITISGAYSQDGVTTSGSLWIAGIKYLDFRPSFGAAEALGAVDQAGGTIYGATNLATYSGNVGVGTTATTAKLTTVGNGAFDSVVIGDVTNSTNSTYSRTVYGTGRRYTVGVGGANETDLGVANKFYVYDANASAIRTVIDANGNVGVGTTAPSATLSVIGTVSINGTYGYTGSGSNCTITSITSGIITGASCV